MLLSEKNRKDVTEIPAEYLKGLTIEHVSTVDDVLARALLPEQVSRPLRLSVPAGPLPAPALGVEVV